MIQNEISNLNLVNNQTTSNINLIGGEETASVYNIRQNCLSHTLREPLPEYKSQVTTLEKELFQCLNLEWGVDIISEDVPLIDEDHKNYYIHMLRTANPDPKKKKFLINSWIFIF